jgi:hypothetical protein
MITHSVRQKPEPSATNPSAGPGPVHHAHTKYCQTRRLKPRYHQQRPRSALQSHPNRPNCCRAAPANCAPSRRYREIPIARRRSPRPISRGFVPWRLSDDGPGAKPLRQHGAVIRNRSQLLPCAPQQKQPLRASGKADYYTSDLPRRNVPKSPFSVAALMQSAGKHSYYNQPSLQPQRALTY